jgi:nucleoside-diphosphate-sugar epimerase
MDQKILVIGGGGYLGVVLVKKLLENNYSVRILDSFIYGKHPVEQFKKNRSVEIIEGDIRNIATVNSSMNGVDGVILLAAIVGDPASISRPEQTIETNFLAAQITASACKLKGIKRFFYASTCSVYGTGNKVLDENAPLNPVSLYARTKISSEQSILQLADHNFSPVIMRMSTLYGYSPRMRFDLVVNTMTMTAFLEKKIKVYGGSQWRPLLHVEDAASSYLKVLESDSGCKIFNICSDEQNYRIGEISEIICKSVGRHAGEKIPVITETNNTDARDYRVSFKKIEDELGFRTKYTVAEAAIEIYDLLESGIIKNPKQKVYYNHYFDSSEELIG